LRTSFPVGIFLFSVADLEVCLHFTIFIQWKLALDVINNDTIPDSKEKLWTHTTSTKPMSSYVDNPCWPCPLPTMVTLEMASRPLHPPWAPLSLCEPDKSCQEPPFSLVMTFPIPQCILGVPDDGPSTDTYAQCYGTNGNPLVLAIVTMSSHQSTSFSTIHTTGHLLSQLWQCPHFHILSHIGYKLLPLAIHLWQSGKASYTNGNDCSLHPHHKNLTKQKQKRHYIIKTILKLE